MVLDAGRPFAGSGRGGCFLRRGPRSVPAFSTEARHALGGLWLLLVGVCRVTTWWGKGAGRARSAPSSTAPPLLPLASASWGALAGRTSSLVRHETTLQPFRRADAPMPWLADAPTARRTDESTRPLVGRLPGRWVAVCVDASPVAVLVCCPCGLCACARVDGAGWVVVGREKVPGGLGVCVRLLTVEWWPVGDGRVQMWCALLQD